MLFLRLLPLITPFLILVFDEIYFFFPKFIFVVSVFILLTIFFAVWRLSVASTTDKNWWNYLILPAVLSVAVPVYSIFLINKFFVQFLFIANLVILYFYFKAVYYYLVNPEKYKPFSIENISSAVDLLNFFLVAAIVYGLQSFLDYSVLLTSVSLSLFVILIIYQRIWAGRIPLSIGFGHVLINCLILLEFAWAISFLPVNYNIAAIILAIFYYTTISLTKHYLSDKLSAQAVRTYLIFAFISLAVILVTASWF